MHLLSFLISASPPSPNHHRAGHPLFVGKSWLQTPAFGRLTSLGPRFLLRPRFPSSKKVLVSPHRCGLPSSLRSIQPRRCLGPTRGSRGQRDARFASGRRNGVLRAPDTRTGSHFLIMGAAARSAGVRSKIRCSLCSSRDPGPRPRAGSPALRRGDPPPAARTLTRPRPRRPRVAGGARRGALG